MEQAIGKVRDAMHNGLYVVEMLGRVEKMMNEFTPVENGELCEMIMASAGLRNAIEILDKQCLIFLSEALASVEGGAV